MEKNCDEYIVVVSTDFVEFGKTINSQIALGWKPIGGVTCWVEPVQQNTGPPSYEPWTIQLTHMAQAMVR